MTGMISAESSVHLITRKQKFGLAYGLIIGLTYALTFWLMDAIALAFGHAPYPWLKLVVGGLVCSLVGGLAGWLTIRVDRTWAALLFWLAAALAVAWISVYLPLKLGPGIIQKLDPHLDGWMNYPFSEAFRLRMWFVFAWLGVFCVLAGLGEITLVESATHAIRPAGQLIILLPAIALFIAGILSDELINKPLRDPIVLTNNVLQFAINNEGKTVDKKLAREMHLAAITPFADLLHRHRQVILGNFDLAYDQASVLIHLEGTWLLCDTFSGQPVNCKQVTSPPENVSQ
jgi:hypothetical protein